MADQMETGSTGSPVEAVDRALLVMQALAPAGPAGMGLAELASILHFNKATLHRVLAALRHRGFVAQDPATGSYLLGAGVVRLVDEYLGEENLPALVHPALVALSATVGELVHLGVLSGRHVTYLDKVEPERAVRVWSAIGRRSPAVTTALGRALLAFRGSDREMLAAYVGADDERPVDVDHLWAVLQRARETGYATEDQENEVGISCIAVPLVRSGSAIAAVSITAPSERMGSGRLPALHEQMRQQLVPLLPDGITLPH